MSLTIELSDALVALVARATAAGLELVLELVSHLATAAAVAALSEATDQTRADAASSAGFAGSREHIRREKTTRGEEEARELWERL